MYDGSIKIGTSLDNSGLEKGLAKLKNSLLGVAGALGVAFGTAAIVNFGKAGVEAASELSNALQGLQSIVEGQGRSFSEAQGFIEDYISDGLVPMANAVTAYKNLASRGYDDTQIQQVMTALKDSAAFGRQASYSLGDAVTTATEGLKNENSVLVDNAGVTKNVAKMWDEYARSIGTTAAKLTQEQKIQAEVNGILTETRFQTGDAAKVAQSYSGQVSQLAFNFQNLKVAVGEALIPIAQAVLPSLNAMITGLTKIVSLAGQVVTALFGTQSKKQKEVGTTASRAAKQETELAKATDAAAKAAKGAISSFDELNVVQSDKGGGVDEVTTPTAAAVSVGVDTSGMDKISPKAQEIADKIKKVIDKIKQALSKFAVTLTGIGVKLAEPFERCWAALKGLWETTLFPFIDWMINAFIGPIATAFSNSLLPIFSEIFPVALEEFARDFEFTCQKISEVINNILTPALSLIKTVVVDIFGGIKAAWEEYGASILEKFQEFKGSLREIWDAVYTNVIKPTFDKIFKIFTNLWTNHLKPLWDNITAFFGSLVECLLTVWNNFLAPLVHWIVETFGPYVSDIIENIGNVVSTTWETISDVVGGIIKALTGVLDFITGIFSQGWDKAWEGIKKVFSGIWDSVVGVVRGTLNRIVDVLNTLFKFVYNGFSSVVNTLGGVAGAIGSIFGQDWDFEIPKTVPTIPHLATGAVIPPRAEYLAVLGDQRHGRNIETPESLMRQIVREEGGSASEILLEQLVSLTEQLLMKDTAVTVSVNDRELARAVTTGTRKLGYPIMG